MFLIESLKTQQKEKMAEKIWIILFKKQKKKGKEGVI